MTWHPAFVVIFLTGLVSSGNLSTNMYAPSMPAMVSYFGTTAGHVELTLSAFLVAYAFAQLVWGPLSDRYGRRPVLLVGLVLYTVATLLCVLAPSIEWLIAGRALQAVGACSAPIAARALMRDIYDRERLAQVMAYVALAMGLAPSFAPVLGGFLQLWFDWQASFYAVAGFTSLMLVWALFMPETNKHRGQQTSAGAMAGSFVRLLRSREVCLYILVGCLTFAGMQAFQARAPHVLISELGLAPEQFGLVSVAPILSYLFGSLLASRLTQRRGLDRMIPLGMWVMMIGVVVLIGTHLIIGAQVWSIMLSVSVLCVGMALMFPASMTGAISVFPAIAGAGAALFGFVQFGAAFLAVSALAMFAQGPGPMVVMMSLCVVLAMGFAMLQGTLRRRIVPAAATQAAPAE